MKKNTPHKEAHPVDAYFREHEANIPVSLEDVHWAALQAMLRESNRPGDVPQGHNAADTTNSKPGSSGFRFLTLLAIVFLLCSSAWMLVAYQQNIQQNTPAESFENNLLGTEDAENRVAPVGNTTVENTHGFMPNEAPFSTAHANKVAPDSIQNMAIVDSMPTNQISDIAKLPADSLVTPIPTSQKEEAPVKKKKKHLIW